MFVPSYSTQAFYTRVYSIKRTKIFSLNMNYAKKTIKANYCKSGYTGREIAEKLKSTTTLS